MVVAMTTMMKMMMAIEWSKKVEKDEDDEMEDDDGVGLKVNRVPP